ISAKTSRSRLCNTSSAWMGVHLDLDIACHSLAVLSKVSASLVTTLAFSSFLMRLGSRPRRREDFASSRAVRASARLMPGYGPIVRSFSLPSNSYRQRQCLPPAGVTYRCRPPPSVSLYGLSDGLALRHAVSVNIPGFSHSIPGFIPHYTRFSAGRDG